MALEVGVLTASVSDGLKYCVSALDRGGRVATEVSPVLVEGVWSIL